QRNSHLFARRSVRQRSTPRKSPRTARLARQPQPIRSYERIVRLLPPRARYGVAPLEGRLESFRSADLPPRARLRPQQRSNTRRSSFPPTKTHARLLAVQEEASSLQAAARVYVRAQLPTRKDRLACELPLSSAAQEQACSYQLNLSL